MRDHKELLPVKIVSILAGLYFMFLTIYWIIVFWWSHMSRGGSKSISFTIITTLWIVLCLYFIGITSSLATEIYEHRNTVANFTEISTQNFPVYTLGSMVLLWIGYILVFIANVIFAYKRQTPVPDNN